MSGEYTPSPGPRWHNRGYLPHFEGGAIPQTITFRLQDSLPAALQATWASEMAHLPEAEQRSQKRQRIEAALDSGYGSCLLANPDVAGLVVNSLKYFDGERYHLHAWCVMPNHVHVLVTPLGHYTLSSIIHSWKSHTANRVNKRQGRRGAVWMQEYFDRAVRDERHFIMAVEYIENNPVKAGLCAQAADWAWSSAGQRTEASQEGKGDTLSGRGRIWECGLEARKESRPGWPRSQGGQEIPAPARGVGNLRWIKV